MNLDSFIEMEKLNSKEIEQVKEYVESLKRSRHKQENEKCTFWQRGCNNQVCPMVKDNSRYIWYSEEDTCSNPEYKDELTVINQKKLKKKKAQGYFTYEMLNMRIVVKKGISGIDPDVPEAVDIRGQKAVDKLYKDREDAWFNAHQEITDEQIEKKRITGMKNIEALRRYSEGKNNGD